MWDVMEKEVGSNIKSRGNVNCVEKVDVKVRNVMDSEIDMIASMMDSLGHLYLKEQIIHINAGRKDFVLSVGNCTLAPLKEALRVLLQVVSSERITLDT